MKDTFIKYGNLRFGLVKSKYLLYKIFKLRYDIYVTEFGFENISRYTNKMETDKYDKYSIHFACVDENDSVIGTIRLILNSVIGFPIEHACKSLQLNKKIQKSKIGEISRLSVHKLVRYNRKQNTINIVLGLYQVLYHESRRLKLTHWYMITDEKLFNTLKMYGFEFNKLGKPIQYHGLRTPYIGIIHNIEQNLIKNDPDMFKLMLIGLEKQYHPIF